MDILADMNRRDRITILVSLHQVEYGVKYCPRTIALKPARWSMTAFMRAHAGAAEQHLWAESSDLLLPSLDHASISLRGTQAAPDRSSGTPLRPSYPDPQHPVPQRLQPAAAAAV